MSILADLDQVEAIVLAIGAIVAIIIDIAMGGDGDKKATTTTPAYGIVVKGKGGYVIINNPAPKPATNTQKPAQNVQNTAQKVNVNVQNAAQNTQQPTQNQNKSVSQQQFSQLCQENKNGSLTMDGFIKLMKNPNIKPIIEQNYQEQVNQIDFSNVDKNEAKKMKAQLRIDVAKQLIDQGVIAHPDQLL